MWRAEARWTGGAMGAGLSVFHFNSAEGASPEDLAPGLTAFFSGIKTLLPPTVTVQVSNTWELRDEATGNLTSIVSTAAQTAQTGTGSATGTAAGVGMRVRWATNGIRNGRAVIGTTFLVPIPSAGFEANGTLQATYITAATSAGNTLLGAANSFSGGLGVWSRPSVEFPAGQLHLVESVIVPDQASWLTTRRS